MLPKNMKSEYSSRNDSYNNSYNSSPSSAFNSNKISPAAKIKVIGVGGGGCNAIKRMIEIGVDGVDFWAMNTDLQVLKSIHADGIIQLGASITRGLGAGMAPEVGKQSAEESEQELESALTGADMVFITAGMGGGTGTGAAPVVAEIAKRLGILTIGVVTKPFDFEGAKRKQLAEDGIEKLKQNADAVIIVPNQKLLQIVDKRTSIYEAFRISDDVLRQAVQGISDLINYPGEINVDFADVRAIMSNAGTALMGMGRASGNAEGTAIQAALQAIESPLIELSIEGAKGVLINVQGGKSLTLFDVNEAAEAIQKIVDPEAKIIFGFTADQNLQDEVRVTVIATGFTHDRMDLQNGQKGNFERGGFDRNNNSRNSYPFDYNPPRFNNNLNNQFSNQPQSNFQNTQQNQQNSNFNRNQEPQIGFRLDQNSNGQRSSQGNHNNEFEENDLDIPTFLRNKLKKNPPEF
jgi:cell division protein FtsZ